MQYDFDELVDRRHSNSLKWDVGENELPMWVADMDFKAAPAIREALLKRWENGVFGYTIIPDQWNKAIQQWWERRHHFTIKEDWLIFCTGVVPAISSAVRKLTTPAEKVLVQTPVYNIFFNSIVNNGRTVIESPLIYDGNEYSIDFDDLESKLADPQTTLMILCNPHNPIGKIWDRDTLWKIGELCWKHHVTVISDEIHCDLCDPGKEYIPFASVSEHCLNNSITCLAPTKAFNLAGLQTAAVFAADPHLRHKIWRALNTDEVAEPNAFAIDAAIAAFTQGEAWLDELRQVLYQNKQLIREALQNQLPEIKAVPSEATYLLWLDCSKITADAEQLKRFLRKETGLYVSSGAQYGASGKCFLRLNAACPKALIQDGTARLIDGVSQFIKQQAGLSKSGE